MLTLLHITVEYSAWNDIDTWTSGSTPWIIAGIIVGIAVLLGYAHCTAARGGRHPTFYFHRNRTFSALRQNMAAGEVVWARYLAGGNWPFLGLLTRFHVFDPYRSHRGQAAD